MIKRLIALCLLCLCGTLMAADVVSVKLADIDKPRESHWRDAFAATLEGAQTEVVVRGGRVDILTDAWAIEVDKARKWHESIGQALHYALYTKRKPAIALYDYDTLSAAQKEALGKLAKRRKIQVFILRAGD